MPISINKGLIETITNNPSKQKQIKCNVSLKIIPESYIKFKRQVTKNKRKIIKKTCMCCSPPTEAWRTLR